MSRVNRARTFMSFRSGPFPPFKAFLIVLPKSSAIAAFSVGSLFSISSSAFIAPADLDLEKVLFPDTRVSGSGVSRASLEFASRVAARVLSTSRRAVREVVSSPTRARLCLLARASLRRCQLFPEISKNANATEIFEARSRSLVLTANGNLACRSSPRAGVAVDSCSHGGPRGKRCSDEQASAE